MDTLSPSTSNSNNLLYFPVIGLTKSDLMKQYIANVTVNEVSLVLVYKNGTIYSFQGDCPHQGGPLCEGEIEELPGPPVSLCIKCPWHGWKFNINTGECCFPGKKRKGLQVYPVKILNDEIRIGFQNIASQYFNNPPP